MKMTTRCTRPQYVCANEKIKLIGGIDGYFPDYGHHLENEMGGLWLYPVKLLDGFWMHFTDHTAKTVSCYMKADQFENYPHKNEFYYNAGLGHTTVIAKRTQIAPEGISGIIVKYEFENRGKEKHSCTTRFLARINLRPVWLSEEIGVFDGAEDTIKEEKDFFVAKDSDNPWYACLGCTPAWEEKKTGQFFGPENTVGNGISCEMAHHFDLEAGEKKIITFYLAGSDVSEEEAKEQFEKLHDEKDFEKEKENRYDQIRKISNLETGDERFDTIYNWVKVNNDWLILDHKKYGRGIMAGLPEYPWWFGCDSFYSLQGVLGLGDYKLCKDTLALILKYSEELNGNGRIVHEILSNGHCPNYGNTQETAHFITMVWKYYEWTNDKEFLLKAFPYMTKSVNWLREQDEDNDLFPSGYGIIEIAGLNMEMIDTAVYTCEAYECYSKMCRLQKKEAEEKEYSALYHQLKDKINEALWDDNEGLYCDAFASFQTINEKREILLQQLKSAKSLEIKNYILKLLEERKEDGDLEKGWLLNRNWVINTPMEIGIAPKEKAERALRKMRTSDYIGRYGMYLDALKQDAAMTINTGVMAVAQVMYGYADEALTLIEKIFSSFSMATPGSISEMSPDYGCFTQAWTVYSVLLPVVRFFYGVDPHASEGKIVISPCMPSKWKKTKLEQVKVLDGFMSFYYEEKENTICYDIINETSYPVSLEIDGRCKINGGDWQTGPVFVKEGRILVEYEKEPTA